MKRKHTVNAKLQWLRWVTRDVRLTFTARLVAAIYEQLANEYAVCWPHLAYVATELGVSTKTVQRANRELIRFGYIRSVRRLGRSNRYELIIRDFSPAGEDDADEEGGHDPSRRQCSEARTGVTAPPDASAPGIYSESIYGISSAPLASKSSTRARSKGFGTKEAKSSKPILDRSDRGRHEVLLAERFGDDAYEVMSGVSKPMLERLFRRREEGTLEAADLAEARKRAKARRDKGGG